MKLNEQTTMIWSNLFTHANCLFPTTVWTVSGTTGYWDLRINTNKKPQLLSLCL